MSKIEKILWNIKDKEKEIEKLGAEKFLEKYDHEITLELIKACTNKHPKPEYLNKIKEVLKEKEEYAYLKELYKLEKVA